MLALSILLVALASSADGLVWPWVDRVSAATRPADGSDELGEVLKRMEEQAANMVRHDQAESHFADLRTKIAQRGIIPVIVQLRAPFRPESELSNEVEVNGQRNYIRRIQNSIITNLFGYDPASLKQYECIPYLALRVNSIGLEWLNNSSEILDIGEDTITQPALTESVKLIGGENAWKSGYTGAGQTIAVIDSGVDSQHPFLEGKVVAEACFSTNFQAFGASSLCPGGAGSSTATDSGRPCSLNSPACGHGTQIAGIAAGRGADFSGVAKDATVISIQAFTRFQGSSLCGAGVSECIGAFDSDLLAALEQVYLLRKFYAIAAVNLSAGSGRYSSTCDSNFPAMKSLIDQLQGVGVATVVASGNQRYTNAINTPACISSTISVGSTTGQPEQVSSFSNSSTLVKLLAPGENIKSSIPGGDYRLSSGTSMAAPHVSGAFALARQKAPHASVATILSSLTMTGVRVTDPRNNVTRPRIQVDAALSYLATTTPPNPIPSPPSDLTATASSRSMITLRWRDNSNNENGFLIRRRTDTEYGWSIIGRVPQGVNSFQHTNLRPGMTYYYSIIAFNATGESEMSNEAYEQTPDSGPAAPTRLAATVLGKSEIVLNWQDNSNEETGYRIYRRRGNGDGWVRILTVGANLTSLRLGGLNQGMVYYFAISAVSRSGESGLSNEVSTMTGLFAPRAPSAVRAVPMSTSKISLSWQDNSDNELGFRVRRRLALNQDWEIIAEVGANITSYDDRDLPSGANCYYLVTALNTAGESALSGETMAVTLLNDGLSIPESPSDLIAMANSNSNVELQWIDNSTSEMGFQIWEQAGSTSQWRLVAMISADTTTFERNGLLAGESYTYLIRSYNGAGESVDSNKVSVMVPKMNFIPLGNNQTVSQDIDRFESRYFRIYAPAGVQQLTIETGGDGNIDLYLRAENQPNRLFFNCRSMHSGSNERCTIKLPQAGNWHILAYGNHPLASRFTISARYTMK